MESAMHDSPRYRDSAAKCLSAAQQACEPYYRSLHLSMAVSWLSLARRDEAIERLFQGTGYKLALRREDRAA
jgi:hypothetical protein